MTLDVQTLLVVMMINMIALSAAVALIMGWQVSRAARFAQATLIAQTLGWCLLVVSSLVPAGGWADRLLSTLSMVGLSVGLALLWQSLRCWLGPRPGAGLLWSVALLMPLGYGIGFGHYAFRVGWANAGLALLIAVICVALAWPAPQASRRWRAMMGLCLGALGLSALWRGVVGVFFTASYPDLLTPHPATLAATLLSNLTMVLTAVGLLVAWREETERALRTLARTDGLTGMLNRRAVTEGAAALLAQARRHGDALAVLMIDLDHFKQINDSRGHAAGDSALRLLAGLLQTALRRGDLAGRWGGEEFCVLLPRSAAAAAIAFDQRLRDTLDQAAASALGFPLAFSTGLASLQPDDADFEAMLRRADAALYAAKAAGRGRLVDGGASDADTALAVMPIAVMPIAPIALSRPAP